MATTSVAFKDPFVREYARRIQMGEVQPPVQLASMFAGNGYFDPSKMDAIYSAINQFDPQGAAAVRFRVGDVRDADTQSLGANDTLTWKSAADENDWMAPAAMIAGFGGAGYLQGAFNGLPGLEGVVGSAAPNYASVGGTGGLNDIMGQNFNPGSAAGSGTSGMTLNNLPSFYNTGTPGLLDGVSPLTNAAGNVVDAIAPAANGAYQFPWGNVIGSVLGAVGANSASKDLADAMRYATDKADPFSQERPFYQGQLKSMYTDPNYFSNSPIMKGLVDTSLDQTQRKLASQGYNYSGNTQSELAKLATNESFKYAQSQQDMTAKAAGAYNGPGSAGTVAATGAAAQLGLNNQLYGNLGSGFQSIINGSQPTLAQQVNGAQPRMNLADAVYTGPVEGNQTNRNWSF